MARREWARAGGTIHWNGLRHGTRIAHSRAGSELGLRGDATLGGNRLEGRMGLRLTPSAVTDRQFARGRATQRRHDHWRRAARMGITVAG